MLVCLQEKRGGNRRVEDGEAYIVSNVSVSGASKRLNRKDFALLHLRRIVVLDDGHALSTMNLPLANVVTVEIPNTLHGECLLSNRHLITLHDLLDLLSNVAHAHINPGRLQPRIRRRLDRLQQRVIHRIPAHRERRIDDAAVDMHAEVHTHHVLLLHRHLVPRIGRVVRRDVVDVQPRRERHAALDVVPVLQPRMAGQRTHRVLDPLRDLRQSHAGLDPALRPLPHLPVHLGAAAEVVEVVHVQAVQVALLLARRAVRVLVAVVGLLAVRVLAAGEEVRQQHARRRALRGGFGGLLLGLALALLLCCGRRTALCCCVGLLGLVVRVFSFGFGAVGCWVRGGFLLAHCGFVSMGTGAVW